MSVRACVWVGGWVCVRVCVRARACVCKLSVQCPWVHDYNVECADVL